MSIKHFNDFLNEKTLYHGSTTYNLDSIVRNGLLPTIGDFVKTMYAGSVDGDINDYLEEILYATDKRNLDKAKTAIIQQMAIKLNKNHREITNKDFENFGLLAVIKNGDDFFESESEKIKSYIDLPIGVESDDYYTRNEIQPDYILTGKKLVKFFTKYGLYPIR